MLGTVLRRWVHRYSNIPRAGIYKKLRRPERTTTASPFHTEDPSLYDLFPRVGVSPASRKRPLDSLRADHQTNLLKHRVQVLLARDKQQEQVKRVLEERKEKSRKGRKTQAEISRLPTKEEKYYMNKGILGPQETVSQYFEVDEMTGLPYGLGFDQELQGTRETTGQSAGENQIQKVVRDLGLKTIEEARQRAGPTDTSDQSARIKQKLYTQRNPKADIYKDIEFRADPRSQQRPPTETQEVFPEDLSDEETRISNDPYADLDSDLAAKLSEEDALGTEPKLAKALDYIGLVREIDIEDDGDPDMNYNPHNLYWDKNTLSFMDNVAEHRITRPTWARIHELARLKEGATRVVEKLFDTRGRQDTKLWKEKMRLFTDPVPSLKEIMQQVDTVIESGPRPLRLLLKRDEYEGNYHFKPRYLHKDFKNDDFGWAFEHCKNLETVSSGVLTGDLSPRVAPEQFTLMENAMRKAHNSPFELAPENKDAVMLYGILKRDPYYSHYLDNHLRFWKHRMTQDIMSLTARADAGRTKPFEMIPWEAVLINKKADLTPPPKKLRKPDEAERTHAYGSRKCARAYAYISPGIGRITINDKNLLDYFPQVVFRNRIVRPFQLTCTTCEFDLKLKVHGGGSSAQSQACLLATSRALAVYGDVFEKTLRTAKALKVNPRQVERKKTSKYKARKGYTFVKR